MVLYVTRHGETDYNAQGRYAGATDVPLNPTGIAQAGKLAQKLATMSFDAVVCSPMLRARQTADIVCAALKLDYAVYPAFAERSLGVYEGLTKTEAMKQYPDLWARKCTSRPDDAPIDGETIRQACERIDRGMEQLRRNYAKKTVLLVCHGFSARAVHRYCNSLTFEQMQTFRLKNCEVVRYVLP